MSSDIKKLYEEYEQLQKKVSSNPISGKQANVKTNKFNKSGKKNDKNNNTVFPFAYGINKISDENNQNLEDEIKMLEQKSFNLKKKKLFKSMNNITTIRIKEFYKKNGRKEKFNLYNENELGLNKYDDKVNILQSEEDYDSDDMIIMDGQRKAEEDLIEAVEIFKKNGFKEVNNYLKYYK